MRGGSHFGATFGQRREGAPVEEEGAAAASAISKQSFILVVILYCCSDASLCNVYSFSVQQHCNV